MLGGQALRAENGADNGARLLDLNNDGFIDVVIGNEKVKQTRVWSPKTSSWVVGDFPTIIDAKTHFGIINSDGNVSIIKPGAAFSFDGEKWVEDRALIAGLDGVPFEAVRLRDLDKDGRCELIVGSPTQSAVYQYHFGERRWIKRPFGLPEGTSIVVCRKSARSSLSLLRSAKRSSPFADSGPCESHAAATRAPRAPVAAGTTPGVNSARSRNCLVFRGMLEMVRLSTTLLNVLLSLWRSGAAADTSIVSVTPPTSSARSARVI